MWTTAPRELSLTAADVHLWRLELEQPAVLLRALAGTLSTEEQLRAARFRFDRDRLWFTAARGLLRAVLARYLGVQPAEVRFRYGPKGKPSLAWPPGDSGPVEFNLSHSQHVALCAVARGRRVGVDVERVRSDIECEDVATYAFSLAEQRSLRALAPERRPRAFFTCWTLKEAYIKARGDGLDLPLDQFDVSLDVNVAQRLVGHRLDPFETARWEVRPIELDLPEYVAALAVEGRGWELSRWQLDW